MATMMAMSSIAGAAVLPAVRFSGTWSPLALGRRTFLVRAQTEEPSTPSPKPKPSTSIWDMLAFSGLAPERINGHLAMVGFVMALAVEARRGDGLLSQLGSGTGQARFAYTMAVLSVASLVPLQGESAKGRAEAIMNANAELWNGRFAMLGHRDHHRRAFINV